jgi:hypothetical protein
LTRLREATAVGTHPLLLVLLNDGAVKFIHGSTDLSSHWSWPSKDSVDRIS